MKISPSTPLMSAKPRYELLDGLRGVAAFVVLWYHVFEAFATGPTDQLLNHGYLAVDFFFILSGFVVGYAYDDRWKGHMTTADFFKRRLIRLQPMVVLGVVLGVVAFCAVGCEKWDHTHASLTMVMLAMLLNLFLFPVVPGWDCEVRGNGEMFPLNGPNWSLFFEYIGNIMYALVLHRLSAKALSAVVAVSGALLAWFAVDNMSGSYHMGVGWTLADYNPLGGFLRVTFSFSAGLLMARWFKPMKIKGAFWICAALLCVLLSMPFVGTESHPWLNGVYDAVCVIAVFPALLYMAASGSTTDRFSANVCEFLGNISYPVYVIHYPSMYIFYRWIWTGGYTFAQAWPVAAAIVAGNIILAWIVLKVYDEPVRRYLTRRFLTNVK